MYLESQAISTALQFFMTQLFTFYNPFTPHNTTQTQVHKTNKQTTFTMQFSTAILALVTGASVVMAQANPAHTSNSTKPTTAVT
jgi:hypothetical protein